jgi:hemoglobin/transferrin/lactoferrin receptor protein
MKHILLASLLLVGGLVGAQDQTSAVPAKADAVPEIVVTASRAARDIQSEPAAVFRVEAERMTGEEGARTLPDMLDGLPSVMLQKTGYGQSSPYLRGFTGFRTLCLIEGIRLNNSVFRDGPNQYWGTVDPFSLQTAEAVMGPASVLYGSDAVGGSVNALTLAPPDWQGAPSFEKTLLYRGATADRSTVGRAQVAGRITDSFGFVGGYTYKDFGDLRGGRRVGNQPHTGYDEQDYDLRLDVAPDDESLLTVAHQAVSQDDAWRTHKTVYGIDWEGLSAGDEKVHLFDQHRDLTYVKYSRENLSGPVDRLAWTLSRQAQEEDRYRVKADDTQDTQGFEVTTWGSDFQLESDTEAGRWVYGVDYYRDGVDSYGKRFKADGAFDKADIQGPVADDATYETVGLFVQDTVRLFGGGMDVTPGVRYTYVRADADKVKDPVTGQRMGVNGDWEAVAGSLRFLLPLTADRAHTAYAGVSQGFRAPNLSDLTRLDSARSTEIETPVSDLDPERYVAYEIGFKSRVERLVSRIGYYYTAIDDMIVRAPTGRVVDDLDEVTKKNSGDGYIQGVEVSETVRLYQGWSAFMTAAWMQGRVEAYPTSDAVKERDDVSRLMPPTAQLGLRWKSEGERYWAEAVSDLAAKADKLSADDKRDTQRIPPGGTPGYAVYHLRGGARVTQNLTVSLGVENMFDDDYRIHGSGVNEPGRNVILTASCAF